MGKLFTPMCLCLHAVRFGTGVKAGEVTAGYGRGVAYHPQHWVQTHCQLKTSKIKMSTAPWYCVVCVCNYVDQWAIITKKR